MPQLTNLDVEWVSLVDRAAVRDPVRQSEPNRFLIWKRDTSEGGQPMSKFTKEMLDQLGDAVEKEETLATLVEKSEDAGLALRGAARLLAAHKSDLPDTALLELAKAAGIDVRLEKAGPKFGTPEWDEKYGAGAKKKPAADAKNAAELLDALKKSEVDAGVIAEVESALAKAAEDADLAKADPATRARIEKAEAEAKEAHAIAKAERDARLEKEFVVKAESFDSLSIDPAKFGPVLKAASEKLDKSDFGEIERVLKAADEQIAKSSLFEEFGKSGGSAPSGALEEATRKAEELRKSDSSLSDHAALEKVLASDRELQTRYLAEVRGL